MFNTATNESQEHKFWRSAVFFIIIAYSIALYPISSTNYLLFHTLVELTSIAFSFTLFSIGWNARKFIRNDSFVLLAIAFLVVGSLDLLHTLSYKGMGVFLTNSADPPTQYWIAARFVQASSYLFAYFYIGKSNLIKPWRALVYYILIGVFLKLAIWPFQIFPHCFNENEGLTTFKIGAEYFICLILAISAFLFWRKKQHLKPEALNLLLVSIVLTVLSEFSFTLYQDVYGISNVLGHFLKLTAVVALYRAFVYGALRTPYRTLFHELAESHVALDKELEQRRLKEEELRLANQRLEAFARTVSHDLRKPLTVITSGTELLQYELGKQITGTQKKLLDSIQNQGHRMSDLMDDILNLAKIGAPDQKAQRLKPSEIVAQVIEDLSQDINDKGCKVEVEEMPEIEAHQSLVYQLFLNLISNAICHGTVPGKPIEVGAKIKGSFYCLFVKDHGPGISEEDKESIFETFYRGGKQETQGSGIGLAIVQKIASYYSGHAYVEDTPGGGATFHVELLPAKGN